MTKDHPLIYLGGLALTTILAPVVVRWFEKQSRKKKIKRHGEGYFALYQVFQILIQLTDDVKSHRALILASHNGNGVPSPGRAVKITALYEHEAPGVPKVQEEWISRPVDAQYSELLTNLFSKGAVRLKTDEIPDGQLKDHYEAEGVKSAYVAKIGLSDRTMLYLSINFTDTDEPLTPARKTLINGSLHRLKQLYSQFPEVFEESI